MSVCSGSRICSRCIGEQYLRDEVSQRGEAGQCSYCNKSSACYPMKEMAIRVQSALEQFYRNADSCMDRLIRFLGRLEGPGENDQRLCPTIRALAQVPPAAAEDIGALLAEKDGQFAMDSFWVKKDLANPDAWGQKWSNFENFLKTESRFFGRYGRNSLEEVFGEIDTLSTLDGRSLVLGAGPGHDVASLYRARVFQSDERLERALCNPAVELGPPPSREARGGRLNADGISVFYGATDTRVAIAEVRPPVGSLIAVGRFDIVRDLRLLDLRALTCANTSGSVFDTKLARNTERAMFLRTVTARITRPIMPDDEVLDYLPTQAMADFLASDAETELDGILYPSVQVPGGGLNAVVFHKCARVEGVEIPDGARMVGEASTWTHGRGQYRIEVQQEEPAHPDAVVDEKPSAAAEFDQRQPALRLDPKSIRIHSVRGVDFATVESQVEWVAALDDME